MDKKNEITVGPVTANLLRALKDIESARNYYYLATEALRGNPDNLTNHMTQDEELAFDTARGLVEKAIGDNLRTWANQTGQNCTI